MRDPICTDLHKDEEGKSTLHPPGYATEEMVVHENQQPGNPGRRKENRHRGNGIETLRYAMQVQLWVCEELYGDTRSLMSIGKLQRHAVAARYSVKDA
jgi:hypothetical protein